jgi:Skp family chaperone for outer membrane proteins
MVFARSGNYSRSVVLLATVLIAIAMPTDRAVAQYFGGIGIVDLDLVLNESQAMKSAREQLDSISTGYQDEISAEEEALRSRDSELEGQRAILSSEAWNEQAVALQGDIEALDQKILAVRRALDSLFEETVVRIQQILIEEVGVLANERGITLVLPLNSILFADEYFNITEDALARLNERVPTVTLEIEEDQLQGGSQE